MPSTKLKETSIVESGDLKTKTRRKNDIKLGVKHLPLGTLYDFAVKPALFAVSAAHSELSGIAMHLDVRVQRDARNRNENPGILAIGEMANANLVRLILREYNI